MGQISVKKNVGGIEGLCVITPAVHGDNRGYFMETYNENDMKEAGINIRFVQDNQSASIKGVLRGLHRQINYPQAKLVKVIKGSVFDVAVDLRSDSETYGKWFGVELTEENKKQFILAVSGVKNSGKTTLITMNREKVKGLKCRLLLKMNLNLMQNIVGKLQLI